MSDSTSAALRPVRVHAVRAEAQDVLSLDLRAHDGAPLPPFEPGSHIDVEIPALRGWPALQRQYSLANDCTERHRYVIGVGRDPASRGGSAALHARIRAGDVLRIGSPRNNFALHAGGGHAILIAGGIGITPLLSMARRLAAGGRPWTLHYCVRTPARAAFLEELLALAAQDGRGRVVIVFDRLPGNAMLDLEGVVRAAPADAHFYCCGPAPMLKAFVRATAGVAPGRVHVEWFSAPAVPATTAPEESFRVRLERSARTLDVPPGRSILDVLLEGGVDVDYSCREGLCGTCETRVLAGIPDHRDPIYAGRVHPPADRLMLCVSRCAGAELVLDL
ncbi:oxidoreductase [Ramlibacter ginsenosidimutans]|uniref:Oxidoreductase n=1 Tax=Ramlibacter ginsenosidimutans TaxID=502333 RepID=A0A934WKQ6_9BURK|nr:PDR/VanB family oxidoreductase [Ramlibacter ginsenosidimutans]MBK6004865.1 oxidoreductase [Ramlibacter ginsenosidimutans]